MKIPLLALAASCLLVLPSRAQLQDHPVIDKVQVSYLPVIATPAAAAPVASAAPGVQCTTAISLKPGADAASVTLSIVDEQTLTLIYQVSYPLGSPDVIVQGTTLYRKEGDTLYLTDPVTLPLKPYIYELYTEDASGTRSSTYTTTQ